MMTFTVFFLTLGLIGGTLAHGYEHTHGIKHATLALGIIGTVVFTLFLMQATVLGFESCSAIAFWVVGYLLGGLTCAGITRSAPKHRLH